VTRTVAWIGVAREYPRHLLLFALAAGLVCGGWAPTVAGVVAAAALVMAGAPLPRAGGATGRPAVAARAEGVTGRPVVAALAVACVFVGTAVAIARRAAIDSGVLPVPIGAPIDARLVLLDPLHERASGELVARAAVLDGPAHGEALLLRVPDRSRMASLGAAVEPGDIVAVTGRELAMSSFDEIQRRRGALAAVFVDALRPTGARRGGVLGVLDGVRRRAEAGLREHVPAPIAALAAGMILGRDDLIDAETRDAFRASGLSHLLAVSGTNVLLLATLVLGACALIGTGLRTRLALALLAVALYVPLTGAGPSIQRAGAMGAAGLVAALAGRPASRAYALGLAAVVTLVANPYAAGDVGWQLSFAAVVGLALWAGSLRAWLHRRRVPGPLAEAGAMTIAATVATAPLLAVHFGRVSLVSLPANLVVAPVVAVMMWLGMLASAAAQIAPVLATPFNVLAAPLIAFMGRTATIAAQVPHAVVSIVLPGVVGALIGYAVLAAAFVAVRRWGPRVPRGPAIAAGTMVALALVGPVGANGHAALPGETVVDFLDIGQGDATLIRRDGHAVLFDTGPPEGHVVTRLEAVGLGRLDVLVLTHAQADHEGAAVAVIQRFHPRVILDGGAGWPTPVQRVLPALARATGARILRVAAGDAIRAGPLRLRILSPSPDVAALPPAGDPNNRAIVAHLRSGTFDLLLTADAESDVTGGLDLPRVEALKVAHHGSEDAGLPSELRTLQPQVAVIEVGRHNTYGHPTASTLRALRVVGHVYRTDEDGTVELHATAAGMRVETHASG
jgi:competence protein ComEC